MCRNCNSPIFVQHSVLTILNAVIVYDLLQSTDTQCFIVTSIADYLNNSHKEKCKNLMTFCTLPTNSQWRDLGNNRWTLKLNCYISFRVVTLSCPLIGHPVSPSMKSRQRSSSSVEQWKKSYGEIFIQPMDPKAIFYLYIEIYKFHRSPKKSNTTSQKCYLKWNHTHRKLSSLEDLSGSPCASSIQKGIKIPQSPSPRYGRFQDLVHKMRLESTKTAARFVDDNRLF